MAVLKTIIATARLDFILKQEGKEALVGILHTQPHASFVGMYHTYKWSVNLARSKHINGAPEPQNWCSRRNGYFLKKAVDATFMVLRLFLPG